MLHVGSKLDVQVSGEPVGRLQLAHDVGGGRAAQRAIHHLLPQERLPFEQLMHVAIPGDVLRPVMGHENVHRAYELFQAEHFKVADVVDRAF